MFGEVWQGKVSLSYSCGLVMSCPVRLGLVRYGRVMYGKARFKIKKMEEITTIRIKKSIKKRLAKEGSKGDSYEDIIIKLIESKGGKCTR